MMAFGTSAWPRDAFRVGTLFRLPFKMVTVQRSLPSAARTRSALRRRSRTEV